MRCIDCGDIGLEMVEAFAVAVLDGAGKGFGRVEALKLLKAVQPPRLVRKGAR